MSTRKTLCEFSCPSTAAPSATPLSGNNPGDVIAAYATKNKLDILAMGSHGEGALRSMVLGSVAARVAAKCRNALLLIQQK